MPVATHRGRADFWLSCAAALALAGLFAAACTEPALHGWLPACPFHRLTGLYCPGCGSTRMLYYLARGRLWWAFAENPLALALLPVLVFDLARALAGLPSGICGRVARRHANAILALILLFAVLRNIPVAPFRYLAPGGLIPVGSRAEFPVPLPPHRGAGGNGT